jgi:hypothetical protein
MKLVPNCTMSHMSWYRDCGKQTLLGGLFRQNNYPYKSYVFEGHGSCDECE